MEKPNSKYLGPNALKPAMKKLRQDEKIDSIQNVGFEKTPFASAPYSAGVLAYVNRDREGPFPSTAVN